VHMHSMHHHQRRARPLISVALVHLPLAFPAAQLISQLARRGRAIAGRGAGARKASQPLPGGSTRLRRLTLYSYTVDRVPGGSERVRVGWVLRFRGDR